MERYYSDKFFALYRRGGIAHTVAMYIWAKYTNSPISLKEWNEDLQTKAENEIFTDLYESYSELITEIDYNLLTLDKQQRKRYAQMLVEPFKLSMYATYAKLSEQAKEQIMKEANNRNSIECYFRIYLLLMHFYADRLEVLLSRYGIKLSKVQSETGITISEGCENYLRISIWFTPGEWERHLKTPINPLLERPDFKQVLTLCIRAGFINSDLTIIGRNKALMCSVVGRCFCGDKIIKDGTEYKIGDKFPTKHVNDLFHIDNSYQAWHQLNMATPPEGSETITEILQGAAR